jgi:hypothetical protein
MAAKVERSRVQRRERAHCEFSKAAYLSGKVADCRAPQIATFGDDRPGKLQSWSQYEARRVRLNAPSRLIERPIATPAMLAAWVTDAPRLIKKAR